MHICLDSRESGLWIPQYGIEIVVLVYSVICLHVEFLVVVSVKDMNLVWADSDDWPYSIDQHKKVGRG